MGPSQEKRVREMSRWFEGPNAEEQPIDVKATLESLMKKAKDEPYREPKRIEIGTLLYPWYFPDLDEQEMKKALFREMERQLVEYHKSIALKK